MTVRQLPLPFAHRPGHAAADFIADASNAEALAWLARTGAWPAGRLALWGEAGCGKTHLLRVWAGQHGARVLDGAALAGLPPPPDRPVAVDDASAAEDAALLHLLNAAAEAGLPLLLADRRPPARWGATLPDLASRLRATASVAIAPAGDGLLAALLARLLADRQMAVSGAVQAWLLARLPRSPAALRLAAAKLDGAALAAGRRVTIPLAAAALADLLAETAEALPAEDELSPTGGVGTSSGAGGLL